MSWFSAPPQRVAQTRSVARIVVDAATRLRVAGLSLLVNAVIVDISLGGCLLRSWIVLDRGASLQFDWDGPYGTISFNANIAARSSSKQGPAYEYNVTFADMSVAAAGNLARQLTEFQRRTLIKSEIASAAAAPAEEQQRQAYRARVDFPVQIRLQSDDRQTSSIAIDLSSGGMRVVAHGGLIPRDELVSVRFRLPGTPHSPSEELQVSARAVERGTFRGRPALGLIFVEIDGYCREQIARYVHAAQLQRLSRPDSRSARARYS